MQPPFWETHNMIYLKDCCFKVSLKFVFSRHFSLMGPIISITDFPPLSFSLHYLSCSIAISFILFSFSETSQHLQSEFALLCSQLSQFERMSRAGWLGCLFNIADFTWYPQHMDINKHHAGFDQARL